MKKLLSRKKVVIPVAVVLVLLLLFAVKVITGGGSKGLDYYDTFYSVFSNETGHFKYSLDVRTSELGVASAPVEAVTGSATDEGKQFQEWDKHATVKTKYWKYPVYHLVIEGDTESVEPLKTHFTISVDNTKFTEVIAVDGKYYFDLGSLGQALSQSGDGWLMKLGESLPSAGGWFCVPEEAFRLPSRYAEDGEQDLSSVNSITTMYRRFLIALSQIKGTLQSSLGNEGQSVAGDTVTLSLSNDSGVSLANVFKGVFVRVGDFHKSLVETGKSLYTDEQYTQALRETDNIYEAFSKVNSYLQSTDLEKLGVVVKGTARSYVNGSGGNQIDASLNLSYNTDKSVIVDIAVSRTPLQVAVEKPDIQATETSIDSYFKVLNGIVDYFNFTDIALEKRLEPTPDNIKASVLGQFGSLVDSLNLVPYKVTGYNASDFIDEARTGTNQSLKLVVSDLTKALYSVVDNSVMQDKIQTDSVEQYPELTFEQDGVAYTFKYTKPNVDGRVVELRGTAINKNKKKVVIKSSDFELKNLLNSVYPANNETLLLDADNTFDTDKLKTKLTLQPSQWSEFTYYFIIPDDAGHVDLFYSGKKKGTIIEY